jgi:hypothetical protein
LPERRFNVLSKIKATNLFPAFLDMGTGLSSMVGLSSSSLIRDADSNPESISSSSTSESESDDEYSDDSEKKDMCGIVVGYIF